MDFAEILESWGNLAKRLERRIGKCCSLSANVLVSWGFGENDWLVVCVDDGEVAEAVAADAAEYCWLGFNCK